MTGMKFQNYPQKRSYLQKYNIHIKRRIFRVLFVQDTFSKYLFFNSDIAIAPSISTMNIKELMFRGLLSNLKFEILTFSADAQLKNFINGI